MLTALLLAGAVRAAAADTVAPRDTAGRTAPRADSVARPAPTPPAAPAKAPVRAVEVGFGTLKLDGLLQAWYGSGSAAKDNSFRVRRAELKLTGAISPVVAWTLSIDAAKSLAVSQSYATVGGTRVVTDESVNQASRMLQDAFVTVAPAKHLALDAGQLKLPLSFESAVPNAKTDLPERALFMTDRARGAGYGDVRDVGAQARLTSARADLFVGAFNGVGESQNTTDRNEQKAYVGRAVVRPFVAGLQLGASGAWGGAPRGDAPRRERAGVEAQLQRGRLTLRSEAMTGADGDVHRRGAYAHAGWKVAPGLELVSRVDAWDPDVRRESSAATATERDYVAGLNWLLTGTNARVQLTWAHRAVTHDLAPRVDGLLAAVQAAW